MAKEQASRLKDTRVRSVRRLTAGFLHHGAPVWSPDGHMLCFTLGQGPDSHWLLTDRKGRATRVLPGPVVGGASVAPDHRVAYGRQVGATAEIWLLPAIDAQPQPLLGGDGRLYRDPAFSPDGRWLCYAADDGPSESPLRLWLMELSRGEHSLLVAEPPAIAGGGEGPVRAGHPAWSADSEYIFFELAQGEKTAVAVVEVASRRVQPLTQPGFSSPAPVAAGLLCVERSEPDGRCDICLLQYRAPRPSAADAAATEAPVAARFKVRTVPLSGVSAGAREPAAAVGRKGVVHLAWVAPGRTRGGEPQRYDVHSGRLARLLPARSLRGGQTEAGQAEAEAALGSAATAAAPGTAPGLPAQEPLVTRPKTKKARPGSAAARGLVGWASPAATAGRSLGHHDEAPADAERGV
jgi:hypothetical protein